MASWSCVLLRVNVLTLQQVHFEFSVNFDFICHFEFTLSGLNTLESERLIFMVSFVRAACLLLDYPEWAERGMGIDHGDYVTCLPHLVRLPLVQNP
jgi:hypothetical protein